MVLHNSINPFNSKSLKYPRKKPKYHKTTNHQIKNQHSTIKIFQFNYSSNFKSQKPQK